MAVRCPAIVELWAQLLVSLQNLGRSGAIVWLKVYIAARHQHVNTSAEFVSHLHINGTPMLGTKYFCRELIWPLHLRFSSRCLEIKDSGKKFLKWRGAPFVLFWSSPLYQFSTSHFKVIYLWCKLPASTWLLSKSANQQYRKQAGRINACIRGITGSMQWIVGWWGAWCITQVKWRRS